MNPLTSFHPPKLRINLRDNEMMKGAGHVNAGFPEHAHFLSKVTSLGTLYFYGRPLSLEEDINPGVTQFGKIFLISAKVYDTRKPGNARHKDTESNKQ